ncbi:phosphonate transporter [Hydrogenophaga sp. OTU3427]|uniref:phosphonate transporter n=1 Tax=Hydrogenophaga sp. OTU3427 TaxID=3043856 RepID=UPI00313C22D7
MNSTAALAFADPGLITALHQSTDDDLDGLDFGVIGMDSLGRVQRYNRFESNAAGLSRERVLGHALFTVVAPCMNNFMVAQRFDDAEAQQTALDDTLPYVLTLRMRPVKVRLRLLYQPGMAQRFVLVDRSS